MARARTDKGKWKPTESEKGYRWRGKANAKQEGKRKQLLQIGCLKVEHSYLKVRPN